ncbi:Rab11 [Hexamita inflata]|uniref:Rab11 n=1 Tax=Hexamita inflata TaxID=28002 RepID=A0AA86R1V4_9EUKA|nr:Rab11 [Hexamita inflata]
MNEYRYQAKLLLVGAEKTGKTNLLNRLMNCEYKTSYTPIFGVEFDDKTIEFRYNNITIKATIHNWDLASDRFQIIQISITPILILY